MGTPSDAQSIQCTLELMCMHESPELESFIVVPQGSMSFTHDGILALPEPPLARSGNPHRPFASALAQEESRHERV